jgi:hypothetical protein
MSEQIESGDHKADSSHEMSEDQEQFTKEDLQCRFYRNEWPETGELAVVEIIQVNEDGAYV